MPPLSVSLVFSVLPAGCWVRCHGPHLSYDRILLCVSSFFNDILQKIKKAQSPDDRRDSTLSGSEDDRISVIL